MRVDLKDSHLCHQFSKAAFSADVSVDIQFGTLVSSAPCNDCMGLEEL